MKLFQCQVCQNTLHFDNTTCLSCNSSVGFEPVVLEMLALLGEAGQRTAATRGGEPRVLCKNAEFGVCNWLIAVDAPGGLCPACRHNRTIPDLALAANRERWAKLEAAKHHLFYSIFRLGLPIDRYGGAEEPLVFDFLADAKASDGAPKKVLTGHASGVITLNIAEADDAEREKRRVAMGEPYRTALGHFRHEIGHYYWDLLVRNSPSLAGFRSDFGDERADYGEALASYHKTGPKPDWPDAYISAYATAHPWEDFAETWAHYFHIVDGLETARAFGISVEPRLKGATGLEAEITFDPYRVGTAEELIEAWVPLTVAINSVNRSMGQPDLYPFVLSAPVVRKLAFIHQLIRNADSRERKPR